MRKVFVDNEGTVIHPVDLDILKKAFKFLNYEVVCASHFLKDKDRFLKFLECDILYHDRIGGMNSRGKLYEDVAKIFNILLWGPKELNDEIVNHLHEENQALVLAKSQEYQNELKLPDF